MVMAVAGSPPAAALLAALLWSIARSVVVSVVYSLVLLVRGGGSGSGGLNSLPDHAVEYYAGLVRHDRRKPVKHAFSYRVRFAVVDLDAARADDWAAATGHMQADQARKLAGTAGPVKLLTNPPSVGYEQNPISVYYCYAAPTQSHSSATTGQLIVKKCIAEVTNTPWGERVTFVFLPGTDSVPKPLHVSPFMDMQATWKVTATLPGKALTLAFENKHPKLGTYFTASLHAERQPTPANPQAWLWLMPHKVALGIYWEAFRLWWKGLQFQSHPKYIDGDRYRRRTVDRDRKERPAQAHSSMPSGCPVYRWRDAGGYPWR
eukprot:jgi/Chlat1/3386/Chrsp23S03730